VFYGDKARNLSSQRQDIVLAAVEIEVELYVDVYRSVD